MENRVEELEIDAAIARAKADLAIDLVRYLCDELGRSGAISWGSTDLFRQYLDDVDYSDPAEELARLAIVPDPSEATMAEAVDRSAIHMRVASRLRNEIRERLRHDRGNAPS